MDSRREFLKKAALLSGGAGMSGFIPESVLKAMSINPEPNSSYLDAEHVVILMQENRSFDHCYGKLQGVRGFNDPRAISLPNKNKVWLQTDPKGDTYAPFHLNIKDTKVTWMHDLPHSRESQVDAYNGGKYDKWLASKKSSRQEYAHMPLTLGYYDREDIPFYYALADAFTVCDQAFCSSMTPTHPNRYYLWSGTIREQPSMDSLAVVRNSYFSYNKPVKWKTFPERMQEAGVSWGFYQNELSSVMQFNTTVGSWLGNFGCNPLERYAQYHVKFSKQYIHFIGLEIEKLKKQIPDLRDKLTAAEGKDKEKITKDLEGREAMLGKYDSELLQYSEANFRKLSVVEQGIHKSAFITNVADPDYLRLSTVNYKEGNEQRTVEVPKSDIFYQFRKDVNEGKLPTVSYLASPQNFSDHPSAPWYGAWFVSEVLDILTQKEEVWKKTIFILCYDENDGYYDHIPPFSIPNPLKPNTGKVSEGIDVEAEYVTIEQDLSQVPKGNAREGAIGLGFRVPLVVASPWSRGGKVSSQVFDHTSIIQFLEEFTSHKSRKTIKESNITEWRRTICGNLSTVFQPYDPSAYKKPKPVVRDEIITTIHKAKFKEAPANFKSLTAGEIAEINNSSGSSAHLPAQEPGTRPACPSPYELSADGRFNPASRQFEINLSAGNKIFGKKAAGSPFLIYATNSYQNDPLKVRNYAVRAGDKLTDSWNLSDFAAELYHLKVYGPNGFFREYSGNGSGPRVELSCTYVLNKKGKPTGDLQLNIQNNEKNAQTIRLTDNAYGQKLNTLTVPASGKISKVISLAKSFGWYDITVQLSIGTFSRLAGHVETGLESVTDPFMGRAVKV
jgi:phospholipase C